MHKDAAGIVHGAGTPFLSLLTSFVCWKAILSVVLVITRGPGYDTSGDLHYDLLEATADTSSIARAFATRNWWSDGFVKLVKWDAIYFVSIAKYGYVYEQEWAFGWGLTSLIRVLTRLLPPWFRGAHTEAWTAVAISNVSHFVSVVLLYHLCLRALSLEHRRAKTVALLHVIAPGGVFLCAPYGESLFAALSFAGYLSYAKALELWRQKTNGNSGSLFVILAGLVFGIACTIRGNGILSGAIFAAHLLQVVLREPTPGHLLSNTGRMFSIVVGGLCVGFGFAMPQYIAWTNYCLGDADPRAVWCKSIPPSIYAYVQEHYWDNGFLHYWKPSMIPLWLVAAPMLMVLFASANHHIRNLPWSVLFGDSTTTPSQTAVGMLLLPHLALTVLAVTNLHVQIVNRLASAYPLPYLWIESMIHEKRQWTIFGKPRDAARVVISWMVLHAIIQATLYAQFLPPA